MDAPEPSRNGHERKGNAATILTDIAHRLGHPSIEALRQQLVKIVAKRFFRGDTEPAEDHVQALLERILERPEQFANVRKVTLLLVSMRNVIWRQMYQERLFTNKSNHELSNVPDPRDPRPDALLHERQREQAIESMLAILARMPNEDFRRALTLHTFDGYNYRQISAEEGIAPTTAGSRCTRARTFLRNTMIRTLGTIDEAIFEHNGSDHLPRYRWRYRKGERHIAS